MNKDLYFYSYNLFYFARKKRYHLNGTNAFSFFETMAELQHFGAATILIDFTKNALIALFFACKSRPMNDGCVFVMNKPKNEYKEPSDCFDENIDESPSKKLWEFFSDYFEKLYYWEPASFNMRIPAQHSIFVFGKPEINQEDEFVDIIRINHQKKEEILKELNDTYDINDITLFNDLTGFASANNAESKIDNELYNSEKAKRSRENAYDKEVQKSQKEIESLKSSHDSESKKHILELTFKLAEVEFFRDNLEEAIRLFSAVIKKDNNNREIAYFYRGQIHEQLDEYREAIADYTKAIELNSKFLKAYLYRGFVHFEEREYDDAISDFTKVIKLNPKFGDAYFFRGNAFVQRDKRKKAISDWGKCIRLNSSLADICNNRIQTLKESM